MLLRKHVFGRAGPVRRVARLMISYGSDRPRALMTLAVAESSARGKVEVALSGMAAQSPSRDHPEREQARHAARGLPLAKLQEWLLPRGVQRQGSPTSASLSQGTPFLQDIRPFRIAKGARRGRDRAAGRKNQQSMSTLLVARASPRRAGRGRVHLSSTSARVGIAGAMGPLRGGCDARAQESTIPPLPSRTPPSVAPAEQPAPAAANTPRGSSAGACWPAHGVSRPASQINGHSRYGGQAYALPMESGAASADAAVRAGLDKRNAPGACPNVPPAGPADRAADHKGHPI